MHCITASEPSATTHFNCDRLSANQLTQGDIVIHQGSRILVVSEPQYLVCGIVFDALWLDVTSPDNTQQMCLTCEELFELISHTRMDDTLRTA